MEPLKKDKNRFAKYGAMAFQLFAYIVLGVLIGKVVDSKLENEKPYGIAFFCILFLIVGIYSLIKDVIKNT